MKRKKETRGEDDQDIRESGEGQQGAKQNTVQDIKRGDEQNEREEVKQEVSHGNSTDLLTKLTTQPSTIPILPTQILGNILKYAYPSDLARCMRVSETFWELAGPLLYSNVIVNRRHPMSKVLEGLSVVVDENQDNGFLPHPDDPKGQLLSYVQQLTVIPHTCDWAPIYPGWFPNLKTLLILPYADHHSNSRLCETSGNRCPLLAGVLPEKVVIHNSRTDNQHGDDNSEWPMSLHRLAINAATLTLVINDVECSMDALPDEITYRKVNWERVKDLRIIVNRTPDWLDKIAQRKAYGNAHIADTRRLAEGMLAPLIAASTAPLTIYLFQIMDKEQMIQLKGRLTKALNESFPLPATVDPPSSQSRPSYTLKTLSDYIAEGVEDELIWQELQYWREENRRRSQGTDHCGRR